MNKTLLTLALALGTVASAFAATPEDNREFRGAWMHTVYQGQYKRNNTEQNQAYLISQLDSLKAMGVNAILFQVRPSADAFYASSHEPWSRFLTDGGKAPQPYWDPLEFMVEESHKRGMELHAWLNPYRVTTSPNEKLPAGHIYNRHPERFITYDGKIYFDPALPENRQFITDVVEDIVSRYDIDAIHFDDYFYPYPAKVDFPDDASYAKYGNGMDRGDWRRNNVDVLIKGLNEKIKSIKPWVRFGISPFGIFRNKKNVEWGSETNGLSNYDDLYADVLLWDREGWIDYLLPQLYWELEHKNASYLTLIDWWNRYAGQNGGHLYIGQDVNRTMTKKDLEPSTDKNQLHHKVDLTRSLENVSGNCWWPGYSLTANIGGVADSLMTSVQARPAIVPAYKNLKSAGPKPVENVGLEGRQISWTPVATGDAIEDAVRFVVYTMDSPEQIDQPESWDIVEITGVPAYNAPKAGTYVITALDRVNNESEPSAAVVVE